MPASARALEPRDRARLLAGTVARFSVLAGVAVAAILLSGAVQSLLLLDAVDDLLHTAFGRAVLIKAALFAVILGVGWVNRSRLLPRLSGAAARGEPAGRVGLLLRRTLCTEAVLGAAVLAVTGALAAYAPPEAQPAGPFTTTRTLGPARLEAMVEPARAGVNEIDLHCRPPTAAIRTIGSMTLGRTELITDRQSVVYLHA